MPLEQNLQQTLALGGVAVGHDRGVFVGRSCGVSVGRSCGVSVGAGVAAGVSAGCGVGAGAKVGSVAQASTNRTTTAPIAKPLLTIMPPPYRLALKAPGGITGE